MQIHSLDYPIYIGLDVFANLSSFIKDKNYSKIFALVDENTLINCVPIIHEASDILVGCDIIEIPSGEQNKNIETCTTIWEELTKYGADRHSVLLNIGGGVIGDIGGFTAATFKRGMDFINIPTTLLAQVDASIGGKLGVDLQVIKNQIGLFSNPCGVFISTKFLKSLDKRQVLSGFAEIIKHGLISDEDYWDDIQDTDILKSKNLEPLISESIKIKKQIILADPYEKKGLRKALNFGHTIGHAIESYSLGNENGTLFHGEAIAIGMICESFLSKETVGLNDNTLKSITSFVKKNFDSYDLKKADPDFLLDVMKNDKKNKNGIINFTLLQDIGIVKIDQNCSPEHIKDSLEYYSDQVS